jgi:hypothetical protein
MPVVSGIVQEAKALGNSRDMLTWTRFGVNPKSETKS